VAEFLPENEAALET